MLRRVHSIWNHVARSIYPEFTNNIPQALIPEEKKTWRSTFYREKEKAQEDLQLAETNRPYIHANSEKHLRNPPDLPCHPGYPGRGHDHTPMADISHN